MVVAALTPQVPEDGLLILYDGVCGMCNGLVKFLIRRDRRDRYRFADPVRDNDFWWFTE